MKYKNLKWTFSTLGCPELSLEETIALAKKYDIKHLELRALSERIDLPALFEETYGTPEKLKAYLDSEGMVVTSLDTSMKLVGIDESHKEEFLKFIPWAEGINCPYLRIFDGGNYGHELSDEDLAEAIATTQWWCNLKEKNNWKCDIMIETHDCLTATSACLRYENTAPRPIAILWDTHHTWKKGKEEVAHTWAHLNQFTVHTHVKDSISVPSARHPFTYTQLGDGEFDLEGTLKLLNDANFNGLVSLEWEKKWHPYLPELPEALERAREKDWL